MKDYELAKMSLEELLDPILKELTPGQLAKKFTPEQLIGGLTPEQLVKAIEALPLEVREQIKKRLQ